MIQRVLKFKQVGELVLVERISFETSHVVHFQLGQAEDWFSCLTMNVLCRVTVGNQEGIRSRKTSFKCCCRNERSVSELQNRSKLINSNHASVHIHVLVIQFPCLFQLIFILGHDIPYASVFQLSFMNPIRCLCLCLSKFKGKIYAV